MSWRLPRGLGATALMIMTVAAAAGERFDGVVTRVSDGDTVWVRPEAAPGERPRKPVKVRLVGLDAPERCQAHGEVAAEALSARVLGRPVRVQRRATDEHGRALGTLWLGSQDVGAWLVGEGHAWSARWRGDPGPFAAEEQAARRARRGLFAEADPEPPRDFRRRHGPCETSSRAISRPAPPARSPAPE